MYIRSVTSRNRRKAAFFIIVSALWVPTAEIGAGGRQDRRSPICEIRVDPSLIKFTAGRNGSAPEPQIISIFNAGKKPFKWRARASGKWLSVSPISGTDDGELRVTVDPSLLEPGIHEGIITVRAPGAVNSPQQVKVILEVGGKDLYGGFRSSRYGINPFPAPGYWAQTAKEMARRVGGASPAGIWIVGVTMDDGTCELNFPGPGGSYPKIIFLDSDQNEEYLTFFDSQGMSIWLQVEPGDADLPTLIDIVLDRYGRHPCVTGFGVDCEWYRWTTNTWGKAVTDAEAARWSERVLSRKASYSLFLKHWMPERMPPSFRTGLFFINDSQKFLSLEAMVEEFQAWGRRFDPSSVGFQFGYEADRVWWAGLSDPPAAISGALRRSIPNLHSLIWVDFTLREVFPETLRPK